MTTTTTTAAGSTTHQGTLRLVALAGAVVGGILADTPVAVDQSRLFATVLQQQQQQQQQEEQEPDELLLLQVQRQQQQQPAQKYEIPLGVTATLAVPTTNEDAARIYANSNNNNNNRDKAHDDDDDDDISSPAEPDSSPNEQSTPDDTVVTTTPSQTKTAVNVDKNVKQSYTAFDDASWAIRSQQLSNILSPHKQDEYNAFLQACRDSAGSRAYELCTFEEHFRIQMNMYQPCSVKNYTKVGFFKTKAPAAVYNLIVQFWNTNRHKAVLEWHAPTPYHNHWQAPPTILRVDNTSLPGGGPALQAAISTAARAAMEAWTGQVQAATSVYGIRIYPRGSILAPHVDRLPLVSSAIINVAQHMDSKNDANNSSNSPPVWYLEVYDHDGVAHNVSMEPGDMVLYESHSVIHGRPFPLQGDFYANIFIHFEPIGPLNNDNDNHNDDDRGTLQQNEEELQSSLSSLSDLPPYLLPGSSWEPEWRKLNPHGWPQRQLLLSDPILLVRRGDLNLLRHVARIHPAKLLNPAENDTSGWKPIHEACRHGHVDIVKFLVEELGANVHEPAFRRRRHMTPMDVARFYLPHDHPVVQYMEQYVLAEQQQQEASLQKEEENMQQEVRREQQQQQQKQPSPVEQQQQQQQQQKSAAINVEEMKNVTSHVVHSEL